MGKACNKSWKLTGLCKKKHLQSDYQQMNKRTIISILLICLVIFPPIIDIIWVRLKTPSIVENLLKSEKCVLDIDKISKEKLTILLTIEDPTFYKNKGWDFSSPEAGYTTNSQGLVKIIYFNDYKPGLRKIGLLYLTRFALNPLVSKKDILCLFMNYACLGTYQGKEVIGFENASKIYFNKSFDKLTNDEFLSLAAMLIGPNEYNVIKNADKNRKRVLQIKKTFKW